MLKLLNFNEKQTEIRFPLRNVIFVCDLSNNAKTYQRINT